MIYEIVNALVPYLEVLPFADVTVGLVKPVRIYFDTGEKVVPVVFNTTEDACQTGDYIDLLPNSAKRCVIYWEDNGTQFYSHGHDIEFASAVRLVCWFNYKEIDCDLHTDTLIVANVINALPARLDNISDIGLNRIIINPFRQLPKDAYTVFGKYNYNEADVQYVTYPYDFFALDYDIRFTLTKECIPAITLNTSPCL